MYVAQLFAVLALVAQAVALPLDQPTTNLLALAEPVTIPITRKVNLVSPDTVPAGGEANMRAMTTGAIGTQGVLNRANVMYTVNVNIGTPPQTLEVQLDTGSRALWVHSNPCQAECPSKPGFNRGASSTYNNTGETYRMDYPVTHVTGEVGTDTVSLGGNAVPKQDGVPYRIAAEDMYQFRGKANTSSMEETCFGNIFGWI
ncbi:hypothetical protein CcaverHIS002_0504510 [Cutaneotrichosporon cavernicola]|nr:hypothetical protein CcaverHIS002_0504510 [Cutaneotrichosporon cavernicola]BEJ08419.1 hypothetical protein CcaverHIS641_0505040 [Cutaneotrichosporon cavernicola]